MELPAAVQAVQANHWGLPHMIQRIKTHNLLNGLVFSIAEFLFIALVISPFAFYYVTHSRLIHAILSVGIIINCLIVSAIGWHQRSHGERDLGLRRFMDKGERENVGRANPHLLRDTLTITITVLLPYILTAWVAYELLSGREHFS